MTVPVVYRVAKNPPATASQAAELMGEQLEEIPYALGEVVPTGGTFPPAAFTASGSTVAASSTSHLASRLPEPYDIEFIQGDTGVFQWVIADLSLMPDDPEVADPLAPTWQEGQWAAQIWNPYIFSTLTADYWVPANNMQYSWWRGHGMVAEFTVESELFQIPDTSPQQYGTLITLTLSAADSANILPGAWYRWDCQSRTTGDVVKTHLRGRARVVTEWTSG